jgi:hypothetical protein
VCGGREGEREIYILNGDTLKKELRLSVKFSDINSE